MTAAMLALDRIFEADCTPGRYAYRPGRNAQQAVFDVEVAQSGARVLDNCMAAELCRWLCIKHKVRRRGGSSDSVPRLHGYYGPTEIGKDGRVFANKF